MTPTHKHKKLFEKIEVVEHNMCRCLTHNVSYTKHVFFNLKMKVIELNNMFHVWHNVLNLDESDQK